MTRARAHHADRLCILLQRYLADHPHAADTVPGILACWLPPDAFLQASADIDATLARLVAERWLVARHLPGGSILYAANPERCST